MRKLEGRSKRPWTVTARAMLTPGQWSWPGGSSLVRLSTWRRSGGTTWPTTNSWTLPSTTSSRPGNSLTLFILHVGSNDQVRAWSRYLDQNNQGKVIAPNKH